MDIGLTIKSGTNIKGSGSWTKCSSSVYGFDIVLQRASGGYWVNESVLRFRPAASGSRAYTVTKSCYNTGLQDWRTSIRQVRSDGSIVAQKVSNILRAVC
jgi:hypothetical protein